VLALQEQRRAVGYRCAEEKCWINARALTDHLVTSINSSCVYIDHECLVHVLGNLTVTCMKKLPDTDDYAAVLQNFVAEVAGLIGEPATGTRSC
jgi:hypothetical protein